MMLRPVGRHAGDRRAMPRGRTTSRVWKRGRRTMRRRATRRTASGRRPWRRRAGGGRRGSGVRRADGPWDRQPVQLGQTWKYG
ncbi:hypothetical protein PVAP13_9KG447985 [Panicum virgatum]|uniref:Uncharacterized protein n=1 Tax=Panicum virgatum TaxID=38727 RepID=A0A8T0NTH9_PANVG|nr:hypothetical protein PVAP13_9KG447985 [Panicum virgatum]